MPADPGRAGKSPFDELLAQADGEPEREGLRRLREECGLEPDDPVFRLFLAQGHFWTRFWREAHRAAAELRAALESVVQDRAVAPRGGWIALTSAIGAALVAMVLAFAAGAWWGREDLRADLDSDLVAWVVTDEGQRARELAVHGLLDWFETPAGERFLELREQGKLGWVLSDAGADALLDLEGLLPGWDPDAVDALVAFARSGELERLITCRDIGLQQQESDEDGTIWCLAEEPAAWKLPWRHDCDWLRRPWRDVIRGDDGRDYCL